MNKNEMAIIRADKLSLNTRSISQLKANIS